MSGVGLALSGLNIAARLSGAKAVLAKVPPKVWYALAIIAALFAGYLYHGHEVKKHDKAIIAANNAQWEAKLNAEVAAIRAKDAELAAISAQLRKANDEANHAIAADAAAQRMSGPGKAVCPGVSRPPAATGGHQPPSGSGDAPVAPVLGAGGQQLIALPFDDTVTFGATADSWRAEALSWRELYVKIVAAWPKAAPQR